MVDNNARCDDYDLPVSTMCHPVVAHCAWGYARAVSVATAGSIPDALKAFTVRGLCTAKRRSGLA